MYSLIPAQLSMQSLHSSSVRACRTCGACGACGFSLCLGRSLLLPTWASPTIGAQEPPGNIMATAQMAATTENFIFFSFGFFLLITIFVGRRSRKKKKKSG